MKIAFSEPIPMGPVDPSIIEATYRASGNASDNYFYYMLEPDAGNKANQAQFESAQEALEPVQHNLQELMPSLTKLALAQVEVYRAHVPAHSNKVSRNTRVFHIDPPRERTLEVLFSNEQPSEYAFGTFLDFPLRSDAPRDIFVPTVTKTFVELGDQGLLDCGFTIQQAMPFEAMLIRANTAHRTPPVNQRTHKIDRTHMVAIFEY